MKVIQNSSEEIIQRRLQRRFLDRLALRVKSIRKFLIERQWEDLKKETYTLSLGAQQFGFNFLAQAAQSVSHSIPQGKHSPVVVLKEAKKSTEILIQEVDKLLFQNTIFRP